MGIGDIRYTVLQTVNEVQRKLGLSQTSLTANKVSTELVDHINDVCDDLSDFGNWIETIATAKVTAHTSTRDYTISTSAQIKNIGNVFLQGRAGPLRSVNIETMRILQHTTVAGTPSQYCVYGTDSNGNPLLRVRPIPDANSDGKMFSILFYTRPPLYTTADASLVIPFPGRIVVLGTLAKYTLRESGGAPTQQYTEYFNDYLQKRKEALNRFRADTGYTLSFRGRR